MRKLAIAMALASTALATPAVARDNSWYVGVEGGLMIVEDADFDTSYTFGGVTTNQTVGIDHKVGVDLDLIGGYDFGSIRAEAEAGYKRASIDAIDNDESADGSVRVFSAMANLLFDFGDDDGMSGYVGGGIGLANVRYDLDFDGDSGRDSDQSIAYQGIAGVRFPISYNTEVGLKYRYFVAPKLDYDVDFGRAKGDYKSHSLLASLLFNFGAPAVILPPPPPPPPPPAPPATQTCPDGSVILVTDICPAPPPPPMPEPAPERG